MKRITPSSPLPVVTDPVVIDGTTQPGYSGRPVIELRGLNAGVGAHGIEITAGDAITIKVGASLVTLDDNGNITVNGTRMEVTMDKLFDVMSDLVKLN